MLSNTSVMEVMRNCPFCNERPEGKYIWGGGFKLIIECKKCGIKMQRSVEKADFDSMMSELYDLINTWNGEKKNSED